MPLFAPAREKLYTVVDVIDDVVIGLVIFWHPGAFCFRGLDVALSQYVGPSLAVREGCVPCHPPCLAGGGLHVLLTLLLSPRGASDLFPS